jgi:uncharacterized membrane protein (UPF0136 family)
MKSSPLDMFRPWVVLALAIAQIGASGLPPLLGWPSTIVERSLQNQTPAVPISFAFSIWGVIFAGSLAFAIFGLLPQNGQNKLWQRVALLAALLFGLNTLWELYVPLRNLDWGAFIIIAAAAATAITIVLRIAAWPTPLTRGERWCIAVPFPIFAGWLSAATFVGLPSTLVWAQFTAIDPRSDLIAIAAVAGATLLACAVIMASRALPYALTISWALTGVIIANIIRDNRPMIVVAAAIAMVIVIAVTVIALRRQRPSLTAKSVTS